MNQAVAILGLVALFAFAVKKGDTSYYSGRSKTTRELIEEAKKATGGRG